MSFFGTNSSISRVRLLSIAATRAILKATDRGEHRQRPGRSRCACRVLMLRTPPALRHQSAKPGTNATRKQSKECCITRRAEGVALTKSPITINRSANNDCPYECPDKHVEPSVSE